MFWDNKPVNNNHFFLSIDVLFHQVVNNNKVLVLDLHVLDTYLNVIRFVLILFSTKEQIINFYATPKFQDSGCASQISHGMVRARHHGGDQFINLRSADLPLEVSEQSASTIGDGRFLDKLPNLHRKNSDVNAVLILKLGFFVEMY